ncbi:hypothetical protein EVAR_32664_1 [Eumeta japonica]|uniref:Uncharacterized protein n=1 Tax=Eumeta variegata TaxID=151549 RepID=A0A4C1WW19_EUMVA|nr:hypothetical protein EVAR_32664_1 [Eumeta japonica]
MLETTASCAGAVSETFPSCSWKWGESERRAAAGVYLTARRRRRRGGGGGERRRTRNAVTSHPNARRESQCYMRSSPRDAARHPPHSNPPWVVGFTKSNRLIHDLAFTMYCGLALKACRGHLNYFMAVVR